MIPGLLDAEAVKAIHDRLLETEPGLHGDHGMGALEGAVGRVMNAVMYEGLDDAYDIAALYAVAIARGHVFADANKRTALVTSLAYLSTQGIDLDRDDALEDAMVDVAEGKLGAEDFADLLYSMANPT